MASTSMEQSPRIPSLSAQRIHDLDDVERDIAGLLRNAATSVSLLTLPQTDEPDSKLPQGDERPERFVVEVGEYFERLDSIQISLRSALAYVRRSRIASSTLNAPPQDFVPPSLGMGLPTDAPSSSSSASRNRGLQEEKIDRDAWKGVLEALLRIKANRDAEREQEQENSEDAMKE